MSDGFSGGRDSVTEITTTSWFQRLVGSFVGALVGILLVFGGIVLLWWNEGRVVEAMHALDQAAHQIVEIQSGAVDRAADGKLVHLSGPMVATSPAHDKVFGVGGEGLLRLKRTVEMYQWAEHESSRSETNLGGSKTTETTYNYTREWSQGVKDFASFHVPEGHRNPKPPVSSTVIDSPDPRLGAYRVDPAALDNVTSFKTFDPPEDLDLPGGFRAEGGALYRGADSGNPAVGDIRVHYAAITSQTMSVVAALSDGVLAPYHAANGYEIALAAPGVASSAAMFTEKKHEEGQFTWILRGVGFAVLLIGFLMAASPVSVAASVIPFLGDIVGAGGFLVALILAAPLTLLVIAIAWVAHRPLLGIGLIVAAVGLGYLLTRLRRRPAAA